MNYHSTNRRKFITTTDVRNVGKEVQIGKGKVDFPLFIRKLKSIGYNGPIIIEREASKGKDWDSDVRQSKFFYRIF